MTTPSRTHTPWPERRKSHWGLLLAAFILGWTTTGHGLFYFPDELRYFLPLLAQEAWQTGQSNHAMALLGTTLDRPLYYLIYAPVATLQLWANGGQHAVDPVSGWPLLFEATWVPRLFQALLLTLNTFLMLRASQRLLQSQPAGLLAGLLYVLWLPRLMWTRHIMPPLLAETFVLLSIGQMISAWEANQCREPKDLKLAPFCYAGLSAMGMLLVYPGFAYLIFGLIAVIALLQKAWQKPLAAFLLPMGLVTLLMEGLSRMSGAPEASYVMGLKALSASATQGDPGYGLGFLAEFYTALSPLVALLLAVLLLWGVFKIPVREALPDRFGRVFVLCSVLGLVLYGWLIGYVVFSDTALYGRLLLPLSLLFIWQLTTVLLRTPNASEPHWQQPAFRVVVLLILASSLGPFFSQRFPLDQTQAFDHISGYRLPPSFLHSQRSQDFEFVTYPLPPDALLAETRTLLSETPPPPGLTLGCDAIAPQLKPGQTLYLMLNRQYVWPLKGLLEVKSEMLAEDATVYQALYPLAQPIYQFEGITRDNRRMLQSAQPPRLWILRNPCMPKAPIIKQ